MKSHLVQNHSPLRRSSTLSWQTLFVGAAVVVSFALPALAEEAPETNAISDSVKQQIDGILETKASFSPGEQKLSTKLVIASRQALGKSSNFLDAVPHDAVTDVDALVRVSIRGDVTNKMLRAIEIAGGSVDAVAPSNDLVDARMPLQKLESFAARRDVNSIREPAIARTNAGSLTTQAFVSHRAKEVVASGIAGAGVKVGVLSDSALPAQVTALMASGDLGPGTTVLPGQQGPANGSNEGTAMMEIIQDLAPSSQVFFATAFTSEASFAANIVALGAAGCKVVVDDVSYSDEFPFQDATIAKAVNTYVATGGIYFSSAGNSGSKTDGTSTTWEGDFFDGGPYTGPTPNPGASATPYPTGAIVHNFGTTAVPQRSNQMLQAADAGILFWADPIGGSTNDYDLFITNAAGTTLKAFSIDTQNGTQDPIEEAGAASPAAGDRLVIVRKAGSQLRAMHLESLFGEAVLAINTSGQTHGHNAAQNTQCVAATYWNSAGTGTKPFNGTNNPIETFSSDGLRKIFFTPTGTPLTPGNFLFATNGGQTLQKPDFTAADGVTTRTAGFNPFFGTSAAAPHAAAIAALVLSAKPTLTNTQISAILHSTALDNMSPGVDRDGGVGVVMAAQAVQAAIAVAAPTVTRPELARPEVVRAR